MNLNSLNYAQLEYLLTELGYRLGGRDEGGRIWIHPEFEALQWLPAAPPQEQARVHHVMTVHRLSVEKGIVDEERFQELYSRATQFGKEHVTSHDAA